jgi:phenylpropionate dioxygenase-like ring-hydroxylating dioxygenase large terminal subunit
MKREKELSIVHELIRQLDSGKNIDAGVGYRNSTDVYMDPALAVREWESLFKDHPQLIALSGSLPKPGSYLTVDDFGVPILATRDKDGLFHAFVNSCRHRGARVAEGSGDATRFICPFHNWTYKNDGKLASIPLEEQVGAIDKACHGLIELPAVERGGLLWVHPNATGEIDLDAQLGSLGCEIEDWGIGDHIQMGETVIKGRLNWKLANDTFGESYHFKRLHRNTLANIFHGDVLDHEPEGRNHRFVLCTRGIDEMRKKPESEWNLLDVSNTVYYLFPNIQLIVTSGSVILIKIYPDRDAPNDPSKSVTRSVYYQSQASIDKAKSENAVLLTAENTYNPDIEGDIAITFEAIQEVFNSTIEHEDYLMGQHQQRAAESGQLSHLIFGRNEPALHHYHSQHRDAMGLPPLEKLDL